MDPLLWGRWWVVQDTDLDEGKVATYAKHVNAIMLSYLYIVAYSFLEYLASPFASNKLWRSDNCVISNINYTLC